LDLPDKRQVAWSEVWKMYLDHPAVFQAVFSDLRAKGLRIPKEMTTDLIHEFLLERAPFALATFRPERGVLESWLFVVFHRFVVGTFRSRKRGQSILDKWQHEIHRLAADDERGAPHDLEAIEKALASLPPEEKQSLLLFLGAGGGSIREVARRLGLSRWKTERLIIQAFAKIALTLQVDIGLDSADLEMLAGGGSEYPGASRLRGLTGRSAPETKAAAERSRIVLSELLNIGEYRKGKIL
jgi:RNA polymerase sigma factor (sigma-70 family)